MSDYLRSYDEAVKNKRLDIESDPTLPAYVAKKVDDSGISTKIIAYHDPKSSVCENYRAIFTHLKNNLSKDNSNVIALSSSQQNEGSSVTVLNLAVVMARDFNKKVLVIDANLKKPSIDVLMNLKLVGGLSDILTSNVEWEGFVQETSVSNLSVITVGKEVHNSVELLHSSRLKTFLEKAKHKFDYVLCDTPALIPFADTKIISPSVDGIVLIIKARKTRREVVDRAEDILKELHCRVFGYILTEIEYHIPDFIYKYL
jgi:capsular exopolysaccharide synthesis family protein